MSSSKFVTSSYITHRTVAGQKFLCQAGNILWIIMLCIISKAHFHLFQTSERNIKCLFQRGINNVLLADANDEFFLFKKSESMYSTIGSETASKATPQRAEVGFELTIKRLPALCLDHKATTSLPPTT
jgi:hypothetical protein